MHMTQKRFAIIGATSNTLCSETKRGVVDVPHNAHHHPGARANAEGIGRWRVGIVGGTSLGVMYPGIKDKIVQG